MGKITEEGGDEYIDVFGERTPTTTKRYNNITQSRTICYSHSQLLRVLIISCTTNKKKFNNLVVVSFIETSSSSSSSFSCTEVSFDFSFGYVSYSIQFNELQSLVVKKVKKISSQIVSVLFNKSWR